MHSPPLLAQAVAACRTRAVAVRTVVFRAAHLRYFADFSRADPLFIPPQIRPGSRYMPRGGPAALYAAFDPDTPFSELNQTFLSQLATPAGVAMAAAGGLRPDPLVVVGAYVVLSRLLDLFDADTRAHLGIASDTELLGVWKGATAPTPTQELGVAVFNNGGFEGVIYPSAQLAGRKNLVIFPTNLRPGSRIHFRGFAPPPAKLRDSELP